MIRLARFGAKKKPSYRLVVIDKVRARNSRSVMPGARGSPVKPRIILRRLITSLNSTPQA